MNNNKLNSFLPYVVGIGLFVVISLVYLHPLFEGKTLNQSDVSNWKGMSKEIRDYRELTGQEALWTNSMFGGMPAYQVSIYYKKNILNVVDRFMGLFLPSPANIVFLYFLGFFILLLSLKVRPWLSLSGAIAFAFSSYFFIIIEAGHITKAHAIAYMAPVLAGIILTYRRKYFLGAFLTALFLGLEIRANHPQITYYLLLIVLVFGISELIFSLKDKRFLCFVKSTAILILPVLLAVLLNIQSLWGTWQYSKYTIRSKSELSFDKKNQTSGLDKDYITAWSYGIPETLTLFIPNIYGGSSGGGLDESSHVYNTLKNNNIPNASAISRQLPLYWGSQPFTSGPVYVGAIIVFLFVLALFVVKSRLKWWLLIATLLSVFLAWGKHFMPLTEFFLHYIPAYNKFRAVSMTLVIAELSMPVLAILALDEIIKKRLPSKLLLKYLKNAFYICAGLALVIVIFANNMFSFTSESDIRLGFPAWLMDALKEDRLALLRADALRSLAFVVMAFLLLFFYLKNKLKASWLIPAFILLFLIDMWPVCHRYLDASDFVVKRKAEKPFQPGAADNAILQDTTKYYRVLNLTEAYDQSARTSYFHKNIGGYHGAKFRRYQELISYHLQGEKEAFSTLLSNQPDNMAINLGLMEMKVHNMLNTRYIIYNPDATPLINYNALSNAWFVDDILWVDNADQEITALNDFTPGKTAIIDKRFLNILQDFKPQKDSSAMIQLTDYKPNKLVYTYRCATPQLAVFSDIYYDKGWVATIDGEALEHLRANYVLRAMKLPAGSHELVFEFKPAVFYTGNKISLASSVILAIFGLAWMILGVRNLIAKKNIDIKEK